jgi:hypothetical protein
VDGHLNKTPHNEAVSRNTGDFRERSFTKPFNNKGKEKKQQVKPALRLPADRYKRCIWTRMLLIQKNYYLCSYERG